MTGYRCRRHHGQPRRKTRSPENEGRSRTACRRRRYHDLEKIADPQQRAKAESLIRSGAEKDFDAIGNTVERAKAGQAQWEQKRESLSEKTPVRIAGERIHKAVQRRQNAANRGHGAKERAETGRHHHPRTEGVRSVARASADSQGQGPRALINPLRAAPCPCSQRDRRALPAPEPG